MATSNSTNFNATRNEIIAASLTLLGVYRPGGTVSTNDYTFCATQLNAIIKRWQAKGIHLWTEAEGTLFLTEDKNKYTLSSSTTDYIGKDAVKTNLTADASATTLAVTSTVGMTAADTIVVALDDNTKHVTTIVSVDSSTALTITTTLPSTASDDNSVWTYTSAVGRPLYIKSARLVAQSGVERPVEILGREEFMSMPNKSSAGTVNAIYYSPQTSSGLLYVYMTPDDVNEAINFSYIRTIQDFDAAGDDADVPQEWIDALILNLAVRVAVTYGRQLRLTNPELITEAATALLELQMFDSEEGSVRIVPKESWGE